MSQLAFAPSLDSRPVFPQWFLRLRRTAIGRALIASAVIHALLFAFVPGFRNALPTNPLPDRLDVLLKPRAQAAPPAPAPEPKLQPQPRQIAERAIPRRAERREPVRRIPERHVIAATPAARYPTPVVAEPLSGIEPAPVAEVLRPVAPEPPRPAPTAAPVVQLPTEAMVTAYGSGFKAAVDKNRRYPRVAQARGWQGTATVLVKVLPGGRLGDVSITRSSGVDLLDDTARDMVKTAQLPALPEALRDHAFELRVPVEFRLL